MTAEAAPNVLRRKTSGAQAVVGPTAMDAAKAIRVAMAHAGDHALDVAVGVREVNSNSVMPEGLSEDPVESALLVRLQDYQGALGLAVVCPQCVGAVIEASTLGRVFPSEAELRLPTATDAMLVGAFLDSFLKGFAEQTEEMAMPPPVQGYRCLVEPFEDLRAAQMALADEAHKRFNTVVDFGLGAKVGKIQVIVPAHRAPAEDEGLEPDIWASSLEKAVMSTSAELVAQLCVKRVTLSQVSALKVGDLVPLPEASVDGVSLIAMNGKRVTGARLGRSGLMRAVRVRLIEEDDAAAAMDTLGVSGGADAPLMALADASAGMDLGTEPALDLNPAPMGGIEMPDLPMADGMGAAPLELDLGQEDHTLGAIEPAQIPLGDMNIG